MTRTRRTDPSTPVHAHASIDAFRSGPVASGRHEIDLGGSLLDLLVEDRGARHTLVAFRGDVAPDDPVPAFPDDALTRRPDFNLVALADPALASHDVRTAWYLGSRGLGPLPDRLEAVVRHALAALGTPPERTVLAGIDEGAFPAIAMAGRLPDSTALVGDPRTDLLAAPEEPLRDYLVECHGARSATPQLRIRGSFIEDLDLAAKHAEGLPFDLVVLVSGERAETPAVVAALRGDPRLFVGVAEDPASGSPAPLDDALARAAGALLAPRPSERRLRRHGIRLASSDDLA